MVPTRQASPPSRSAHGRWLHCTAAAINDCTHAERRLLITKLWMLHCGCIAGHNPGVTAHWTGYSSLHRCKHPHQALRPCQIPSPNSSLALPQPLLSVPRRAARSQFQHASTLVTLVSTHMHRAARHSAAPPAVTEPTSSSCPAPPSSQLPRRAPPTAAAVCARRCCCCALLFGGCCCAACRLHLLPVCCQRLPLALLGRINVCSRHPRQGRQHRGYAHASTYHTATGA